MHFFIHMALIQVENTDFLFVNQPFIWTSCLEILSEKLGYKNKTWGSIMSHWVQKAAVMECSLMLSILSG